MKRRKNAIYTGKSKRDSVGRGDRVLVDRFYGKLDQNLLPEAEIEIIPPEQVNPTHSPQEQSFIVADYCARRILPEATGLYRWGDEVTPRLRALAPIVDRETADAAISAARDAYDAATNYVTRDAFGYPAFSYPAAAANAALSVALSAAARGSVAAVTRAFSAADCVHHALVTCIEADHEAAYNRIIALTNEMLESL